MKREKFDYIYFNDLYNRETGLNSKDSDGINTPEYVSWLEKKTWWWVFF